MTIVAIYAPIPNLFLETQMHSNVDRYYQAEKTPTNIIARKWMNLALTIQKKENYAAAATARWYAYVASVYSDVYEKTSDSKQASLATASIIKTIAPNYNVEVDQLLNELSIADNKISRETQAIIELYEDRNNNDNYYLIWDKKTPDNPNAWYIRDKVVDDGAMAGSWKTWNINIATMMTVPPPPTLGSLANKVDIEKIKYATSRKKEKDNEILRIWQGSMGFDKLKSSDNINPAGVWQNILFAELGQKLDEKTYAQTQKILAQTIADAFIGAWHIKYFYFGIRPSMQLKDLVLAIKDPPFPGYVSGHSTNSAAAATVLSYLHPEKTAIWQQNASDAKISRHTAGIHFDSDNQMGELLGKDIGQSTLEKIFEKQDVRFEPIVVTVDSNTLLKIKYLLLKFANLRERIRFEF